MLDAFDHLTDILIGLAILFLVPLIYIGLKQEDLIRTVVSEQTEQIVNEIRSHGYLSRDMFEEFQQSLSKTGLLYDITMEHKQRISEPEYRFRTIDEVLEEQNKAFTGANVYHYYPVNTNIPVVTDPINNSGLTMNTETNESVLAGAVNIPSNGHTHTDSCYAGHVHKGSGNLTFTHTHAHTYSCTRYLYVAGYNVNCYSCGTSYYHNVAIYYWNGYPVLAGIVDNSGIERCNNCRSTQLNILYNPKYYYSCGYVVDLDGDGWYDEIPVGVYRDYYGFSSPQNTDMATHTSGCYSFHQAKPYENMLEYWPYSGGIKNAREVFQALFSTGFSGYCTVPQFVRKSLCITDGPLSGYTYRSLTYMGVKQPNGQILFYFSWCDTWDSTGYSAWPSGITAWELKAIFDNYQWSFQQYAHAHTTSADYTYEYGMSGSISTCSFDHTLGTGRWVLTCGLVENKTLLCPERVVSITPTHPMQSVYTNEPLITTVTAAYQDGSAKVVLASTTFSTATPASNQTVPLTYIDSLGRTHTCTIKVNVIPRNKTCIHGHTYNLNYDGSDPGCPFCKAWLSNLVVEFPTTSTFTIYRGTTLSENGVTLLATYLDGHSELLETEYIDNLDKYYVGSQYVTISYKGHYVYLTVVTKRNLILCPVCHRQYELHPDDSDPGCPWCAARTPIFTGNVMHYYTKRYTDEILEVLYEGDGIYRFSDDDFITISAKGLKGNIGTRLLSVIYLNDRVDTIHVIEGGSIREDGSRYNKLSRD